MDIIIPSVSIQQANNIRAQLKLPLLAAWTVKEMTLRDVTPTQASDLVQFVSPPVVEPPAPPVPDPVAFPSHIDGYKTAKLLNIVRGTRAEVGDLRGVALVTSGAADVKEIKLMEYGGSPLNREYWLTPNPNGTPAWVAGGPAPSVKVTPGDYVVFRNAPNPKPPKPGQGPRPLDGTNSAVSAG